MGCCLSTRDHRHLDMDSIGGAPPTSPPPVLDVETVKEVLLETPAAAVVTNPDNRIKALMPPGNQESKEAAGPPPPAAAIHGGHDPQFQSDDEEIVSEVSEMCSYSESYSNAMADKKLDGGDEDDGVVNQRPLVRARRGGTGGRGRGRGRSGERVVSRRTLPAAPSSEKRGQVVPVRSVRGRSTAGQPRNVAVEESLRRREAGDASRRRSRSPVARRNASEKKSAAAGARDPPNDVVQDEEGAESLENPVVSLECFIFL